MTPPSVAMGQVLWSVAFGLGLGVFYGFLHPLREKACRLADGLFLIGAFFTWLQFAFAICDGNMRVGYWAGFAVGAVAGKKTLGQWCMPVFAGVWGVVFQIGKGFLGFFKKIFKNIGIFAKKTIVKTKKIEYNEV